MNDEAREELFLDLTDRIAALEVGLADLALDVDRPEPLLDRAVTLDAPTEVSPLLAAQLSETLLSPAAVTSLATLFGPVVFKLGDSITANTFVVAEGAVSTDKCADGKATILVPGGYSSPLALRVKALGTAQTNCPVKVLGRTVQPGGDSGAIPVPLVNGTGVSKVEITCGGGKGACAFTYQLAIQRKGKLVKKLVQALAIVPPNTGTLDTKCKDGKTDIQLTPVDGRSFYALRLDVAKDSKCGVTATYNGNKLITVAGGGASGSIIFKGSGGTVTLQCGGTKKSDPCKASATVTSF